MQFTDVTTLPTLTPKTESLKADLVVQDGLYHNVSDEVYFALNLYNSSHALNPSYNSEINDNPFIQKAFRFGTAIHHLILEHKTETLAALSKSEQKTAIEMLKAYRNCQEAVDLIDGAATEVVAICNDFHTQRARGKLDALKGTMIVDLKTCANLDTFKLSTYSFQLAFYRSLMQCLAPSPKGYYSTRVIVLEKRSPYRCVILQPKFADLKVKEDLIAKMLQERQTEDHI